MNNRIRDLRKSSGLDASELANLLNISLRTFYKIERGEIDILSSILVKLSSIFNVSTDYILCLSDDCSIESKDAKENKSLQNIIKKISI